VPGGYGPVTYPTDRCQGSIRPSAAGSSWLARSLDFILGYYRVVPPRRGLWLAVFRGRDSWLAVFRARGLPIEVFGGGWNRLLKHKSARQLAMVDGPDRVITGAAFSFQLSVSGGIAGPEPGKNRHSGPETGLKGWFADAFRGRKTRKLLCAGGGIAPMVTYIAPIEVRIVAMVEKKLPLPLALGSARTKEPVYGPGGSRCIGGMNSIQALVWNVRTWFRMRRERTRGRRHEEEYRCRGEGRIIP
jgi:hypothetical protein